MDVRLSVEQQLIAATAARIGAQHAITGVSDLPATPQAAIDAWQTLSASGLQDLVGASEPGAYVAAMLVAEQLAGQLCVAPYIGQAILAPALRAAAGVEPGRERYCVLLTSDLTGFAAPGERSVAFDALGASHGLTLGPDGALRRHALPELTSAGPLDLTRRILPDVPAGAGELLGSVGSPSRDGVTALAMVALAADQLGLMARALGLSVEYAKQRQQFGRVIGANQALAHLLADAAVLVESSRSCVWHAAWALDNRLPQEALRAARQAKAYCGAAAREVVEVAVQVHGGIAITWEHQLHLLLRRVLFDDQLFGGHEAQYGLIARQRRTRPALAPQPARWTDEGLSFADSAEEAAFRERLRGWLAAHAPTGPLPADGDARMAVLHQWHRTLADAGWVGLSFAREYGGQGLSLLHDAIANDELAAAGAPPGPAINHITNAIRLFGTEEQKRERLPGLLDCSVRWCQGFSEPAAGSDLASLKTRGTAFLAADGQAYYRIDGQKLWTSEAVWADWCLLLLRTESGGRPHGQLSMIMVAMSTPGVECRPVRTAYGSSEFAEVFFDGVIVPARQLLGKPGQGWEIAMALLGFERGPADMGWTARLQRQLHEAQSRVGAGIVPANETQQAALARAWVELEALRLQVLRSTCRRLDGSAPGPEGSLDKLLITRVEQRLHHTLLDLAGPAGALVASELFAGYLWSRAQAIFGGTEQIQRDLVAQKVLGLPRPPS